MLLQTIIFHVFFTTFHTLKSGPHVLLFDVPVQGLHLVIFLATDGTHEAAAMFIRSQLPEHAQKLDLRHLLLQIESWKRRTTRLKWCEETSLIARPNPGSKQKTD